MSHPPLDTLIPHRPPARLITGIVGTVDGAFVCRCAIPPEFASNGSSSAIMGIEMGAQAAAVMAALERPPEWAAAPPVGYLVSIRDARFALPELPVGRDLEVRVRAAGGAGPLTTYEIEVIDSWTEESIVSAMISTFVKT